MLTDKYFKPYPEKAPVKAAQGSHTKLPDLNEELIRNSESTYFLRVTSEAMSEAGIKKGDVIIVDRSLEPVNGKVVIAMIQGELLIRQLEIGQGKKRLLAASSTKLAPLELDSQQTIIWGVVTCLIRPL